MGQTCGTVQHRTDRNTLLICSTQKIYKQKNKLKEQLQRQKQSIKRITYIQSSDQLIYQFKDQDRAVQHLQVEKGRKDEDIQDTQIVRYINDKSFVVKMKPTARNTCVWKLFSTVSVSNIQSNQILDYGLFYYNLYTIRNIPSINCKFLYANTCYIKQQQSQSALKADFIIESQTFQNDVIPLNNLGKFMRCNKICWQDKQFLALIQKCCERLKCMHQNSFYFFQDFLIDLRAHVYCIGGFVKSPQILLNQTSDDYVSLSIYLLQTLYGQEFQINSNSELLGVIKNEENDCKFKHPQSSRLIVRIYEYGQKAVSGLCQKQGEVQHVNIDYYVSSYRAKQRLQASVLLSRRYTQIGQHEKAKQVLFKKLGLLLYQAKQNVEPLNQQQKRSQGEQSLQVLEEIIVQQRRMAYLNEESQLGGLLKQYINLGVGLSSLARKQQNNLKSQSILQKVSTFLGEQDQSWLLDLHLAQAYYQAGKLEQAESYFMKSIRLEVNQANICFLIMFYAAVFNWDKAISLIHSYEALITQQSLYDLLISKILLSKGLGISPSTQKQQSQRTSTFQESSKIVKRALDRKNVPQVILCQAFQVLADNHFYLMEYDQSVKYYDRSLAIFSSIDSLEKQSKYKGFRVYRPEYIRGNQLQYTRSITPKQYQAYLNNTSMQSALNLEQSESDSRRVTFIDQMKMFFNLDKRPVLLSSRANCLFMKKKYSQAIQAYQQARKYVSPQNVDLKNSILGNMAICYIEMGKNDKNQIDHSKIDQGSQLLSHILSQTAQQSPQKLQNDLNYIFLASQFYQS